MVAKLISRLWSREYGEKFLVLKGLNASQAENIGVALERKRLAVLVTGPGGWRIIGSLNNYLVHTLNQVMKRQHLTLRELSEEEGHRNEHEWDEAPQSLQEAACGPSRGHGRRQRGDPSRETVRLSVSLGLRAETIMTELRKEPITRMWVVVMPPIIRRDLRTTFPLSPLIEFRNPRGRVLFARAMRR